MITCTSEIYTLVTYLLNASYRINFCRLCVFLLLTHSLVYSNCCVLGRADAHCFALNFICSVIDLHLSDEVTYN